MSPLNDPISFSLFPVNCAGNVMFCDDFAWRTQPLLTMPNVKNGTLDCRRRLWVPVDFPHQWRNRAEVSLRK